MIKAELRKISLDRQKKLSPSEKVERSSQIAAVFFGHFDLAKIKFFHCFLPIEKFGEIDTRQIFSGIWRVFPHVETFVPRVDWQAGEIESLSFSPQTKLAQNRWGIFEPPGGKTIPAEKIDLVIVPLLCFDLRGFRVGYGKGFYDKFLENCRTDCLKIGVSYFAPVEEISDTHSFDVKLDYCVTPETVLHFKKTAN